MAVYIALVYRDEDTLRVEFPDLPGCHTFGHTWDEMEAMAEEAASLYVEDMLAEGEELPKPTTLGKALLNSGNLLAAIRVKVPDSI